MTGACLPWQYSNALAITTVEKYHDTNTTEIHIAETLTNIAAQYKSITVSLIQQSCRSVSDQSHQSSLYKLVVHWELATLKLGTTSSELAVVLRQQVRDILMLLCSALYLLHDLLC